MKKNEQDPLLDFRVFLVLIWRHLGLPDPTRRQLSIAFFLQHGPKRKMVQAARGFGKSWITAAYVLWRLYCNPQVNILVVSASKQRADNFTTFCLQLLREVPFLQHLYPRPDQRCSRIEFDVNGAEADQNPSVRSAGIEGQITGSRADEIVPDDIEVPGNSMTQAMREKLAERVKDFDSILKPLLECPDSAITYLGTPQTESSVYKLLAPRGFTIRVWPARYPNEAQRANYGDRLAPDITKELDANSSLVGTTTEPTRFTDTDLALREMSIGRSTFALQFMLDTALSDEDRFPLRLRDLIFTDLDPDIAAEKVVWSSDPQYLINDQPNVGMGTDRLYRRMPIKEEEFTPYTGRVMSIDPSGRGKDETGYAVVNQLNSQLFLMDAGGYNDGYSTDTLHALAETAKKWKVNKILIESNFGDGMFASLLKPILAKVYPVAIEEIRSNQQKEKRIIDTLEPVMNSHRLVVNLSLLQQDFKSVEKYPKDNDFHYRYMLFYQLTHITRDRGSLMTDDRLDALAIAVAYYAVSMAADVDSLAERERERKLDAELRRFMQHAMGHKAKPKGYSVRRA
jgi:hypothetical protein